MTTSEERAEDVNQWSQVLAELGIDLAKEAPAVRDAKKRHLRLMRYASTWRSSTAEATHQAAVELAGDPGTYDDAIGRLTGVALGANEDFRETILALFGKAQDLAASGYFHTFAAHHKKLISLLHPVLDQVVAQLKANKIDLGIHSLELATRHGLETQWLALEQAESTWQTIHTLLQSWRAAGVMPGGGRRSKYTQTDFRWGDFPAVLEVPGANGGTARGVWLAHAVEVGQPGLYTVKDIEARPRPAPVDEEARILQARRNRREIERLKETAEKAAPKVKPKRRHLPGTGAVMYSGS